MSERTTPSRTGEAEDEWESNFRAGFRERQKQKLEESLRLAEEKFERNKAIVGGDEVLLLHAQESYKRDVTRIKASAQSEEDALVKLEMGVRRLWRGGNSQNSKDNLSSGAGQIRQAWGGMGIAGSATGQNASYQSQVSTSSPAPEGVHSAVRAPSNGSIATWMGWRPSSVSLPAFQFQAPQDPPPPYSVHPPPPPVEGSANSTLPDIIPRAVHQRWQPSAPPTGIRAIEQNSNIRNGDRPWELWHRERTFSPDESLTNAQDVPMLEEAPYISPTSSDSRPLNYANSGGLSKSVTIPDLRSPSSNFIWSDRWLPVSADAGSSSTRVSVTSNITAKNSKITYEEQLRQLLEGLRSIDLSNDIYDQTEHFHAHGGSSDVFKAKSRRHGNIGVAVKRLRFHIYRNKNVSKIIFRELRVWSKLSHPNILPLLGYVMFGEYPALVSKWMIEGSAREYLGKKRDVPIMKMAKGIAAGLSYLHDRNIVHSDLKCDNIFISDSGEPLLADFGISRIVTTTSGTTSTNVKGSTRWMAFELLSDDGAEDRHTVMTDIWAFGMVVYLLTRRLPFYELKIDLLWSICQECWRRNPFDRPHVASICGRLTNSSSLDGSST
ncbi:kinase-like protein [Schizopora paradoxa]|uniref:Kinase-like protein n=1 Tax=Schizopora paradoxa TaxID=27342 RepID=A0A0H2RG48_9AGAM|nr:kinase-like protein [Schizopora paradoxa]